MPGTPDVGLCFVGVADSIAPVAAAVADAAVVAHTAVAAAARTTAVAEKTGRCPQMTSTSPSTKTVVDV